MTMKITGYSGIYRDIAGFRGMDGTMTIIPHGRDAVGSSPGGVRRRQPRLPSPSQPPSWRHEIPRDPIILPSHPAISRYIPVYPTISRYSSVQSHRPPVCADDGHPGRKAVSQEEIARNPIRAELQYASRRQVQTGPVALRTRDCCAGDLRAYHAANEARSPIEYRSAGPSGAARLAGFAGGGPIDWTGYQ